MRLKLCTKHEKRIELRNNLREKYRHDGFLIPYPTMNLGNIHGGDGLNRICACCELQFDVRPLPNLELKDLERNDATSAATVNGTLGRSCHLTALYEPIPGYEQLPLGASGASGGKTVGRKS